MKHQFVVCIVTATFLSLSSFAIDQVTLTTGEVIEGKVLADVPNRHVDIELVNGQKRRYPKAEVSNVERDVPSNKDTDMYASSKRIFVGPLAGGLASIDNGGSTVLGYGARIGVNTSYLSWAKFAPALLFKGASSGYALGISNLYHIEFEFLLRRINASGFYLGPQLGIALVSSTSSYFMAGAAAGYDIQLSPEFSIGPDIEFDHIFTTGGSNSVYFGLSALFHFD